MNSRFAYPAFALLVAVALGACGSSQQDEAENDTSAAAGAGSAHGTSIGQTPGYGGKGYAAPGTGGAMSDTMAAHGPLPPSGGVNAPNAAATAAAAGQRDTVGGGTAAGRTAGGTATGNVSAPAGAGPNTPTGNARGTSGATSGAGRDSARDTTPPRF